MSAGLGVCMSVGIPAPGRCTDVVSYHTDVADLQSNIPAPPSMALFPNYCTYMFLLCFCFICMIISFPIKQPCFFSSKESSSIHVFSPWEMPLKQAVCPVLLTPTSINIIFFLQIHQAEVKLDFIASTAEL